MPCGNENLLAMADVSQPRGYRVRDLVSCSLNPLKISEKSIQAVPDKPPENSRPARAIGGHPWLRGRR
jgi:hypothetical protein